MVFHTSVAASPSCKTKMTHPSRLLAAVTTLINGLGENSQDWVLGYAARTCRDAQGHGRLPFPMRGLPWRCFFCCVTGSSCPADHECLSHTRRVRAWGTERMGSRVDVI